MPSRKQNAQRKRKSQPKRQRGRNRKVTATITGSGDYSIQSLGRAFGRMEARFNRAQQRGTLANPTPFADAGEFIGRRYGLPRIGRTVGSLAGGIFGMGDYKLKANSLFPQLAKEGHLRLNNGGRAVSYSFSEYIGDVISSATPGAFKIQAFPINPGVDTTFPWLSIAALGFEKYEFRGLFFEFKSTSSTFNGSSQALGTVAIATDYDPTDAAYGSLIEMSSSSYSCSERSSEAIWHGIECDPGDRPCKLLYTRPTASPPTGAELRQTDWATTYVASTGVSEASVNLGQIWVHYAVDLIERQI